MWKKRVLIIGLMTTLALPVAVSAQDRLIVWNVLSPDDSRVLSQAGERVGLGVVLEEVEPTLLLDAAFTADQGGSPEPDVIVDTIYGYDTFCYLCGYWSEEDGRCSTGWKNKISKDAAVLDHLGLKPGDQTRLEYLQRLLAEKVPYEQLEIFCGPGGKGNASCMHPAFARRLMPPCGRSLG